MKEYLNILMTRIEGYRRRSGFPGVRVDRSTLAIRRVDLVV